ncbi:hypothetical protein HMPREF9565_01168 [Cutibacterium acnes HL053PA2]|nr:hypothetical protein HMPREF9574_00914 [Cutibacterium acnes HL074PA1]EFS41127.1 hypothetical protein HMPREF9575_01155 [Cutibacterium acnes HL110PA1]EFS45015.1 hypothetical protein HMPREF9580_02276 [Cutibacterium acnes HL087PA2]EFS48772.1 hypothetical protein HMPREF9585_01126 [Cutibacterium acnes HL083PA1]EFS52781.1 hypothetical protein HMPREF9589_01964 [Cutibacterium acnes HL059PA1]EFS55090.1 hypothetical protein HMPREF9593_02438 [Cutibacterium acnes HL046PA2]EFS59594.1 hypothetical protein
MSRISRWVIDMLAPLHDDIKVSSHHLNKAQARNSASLPQTSRTSCVPAT